MKTYKRPISSFRIPKIEFSNVQISKFQFPVIHFLSPNTLLFKLLIPKPLISIHQSSIFRNYFSNPPKVISEFTKSDCVFIAQSHNNELITEIESSFSFFWLTKPHVVTDAHSAFKSSSTGPVRKSFHALFW